MRVEDVNWLEHLEEAQEVARARRLPIAIKVLGQGSNLQDQWCPAASATRAMALSDPEVAMMLNERFVPVRFGMFLEGHTADIPGRDFVLKDGHYPYPGLILTDPELNVIARTRPTLDEKQTLETLKGVLRARPDLAPQGSELAEPIYDPRDAVQASLAALLRAFDRAQTGDRPALIPQLEGWLEQHKDRLPDGAAMIRTLLGDCHYIRGDFLVAEDYWTQVVELHPKHPVRHRASFNLLDKNVWPDETHQAIRDAPIPGIDLHPPEIPYPEIRAANLARVATDPRYVRSPGGMIFAQIPAGTFTMGGSPAVYKTELPTRRVTLTQPYLLGIWPVTRGQWREFRPDTWPDLDRIPLARDLPHVAVSWHQAREFCEWLSARDGWKYRLATEAEWERAARGGIEGARYPWGNEPLDPTRANYKLPRPVPVGSYPPNGFGLFDMLGNGGEFCADRYLGSAFSLTPLEVVDPQGPTAEQQPKDFRTVRASLIGNGFTEVISYLSWRAGSDADRARGCFGFRVVAEPR